MPNNDPYNYNLFNPLPVNNVAPLTDAQQADYNKMEAAVKSSPTYNQPSTDNTTNKTIQYLKSLHDAYSAAGLSEPMISFNLAQDFLESQAFTNNGALQNNPGNIMWSKKLPYGKKGSYNSINQTYYVAFDNLNDYVAEKINVLKQKPGYPINATTVQDYVHALKLNNYFGRGSESAYLNAMMSAAKSINLLGSFQEDTNQKIVTGNGSNDFYTFFKDHWKPIAGIAGALLLIKTLRR